VQNCIFIDSDQEAYYTNGSYLSGGLVVPSTKMDSKNNLFRNSIVLNSHMGILTTTGNTSFAAYNTFFMNCIFWDSKSTGVMADISGIADTIKNCTFGKLSSDHWSVFSSYDHAGYPGHPNEDNGTYIKNSIVYQCGSGVTLYDVEKENYNCFFGNLTLFKDMPLSPGTRDILVHDPVWSMANTGGGLKYLVRMEDGAYLNNKGEGGVTGIGAQCMTLIGAPGSLWGDTNYAADTGVSMWPFPQETLIQRKMKSYADGGVIGKRGFCADGLQLNNKDAVTLTSYIWEYLGNPIPPEIYGAQGGISSNSAGEILNTSVTGAPAIATNNLRFFPNPWSVSGREMITISDLPIDATVSIYTIAGELIRTIRSAGSQMQWDGRNASGERVAAGIYVISARNDNNEQRTGKLAIIK
jgi:hypothetical protein